MVDRRDERLSKLASQADFCAANRISKEDFAKAELDWTVLEKIWTRHRDSRTDLEQTGADVAERLRNVDQVHSLKVRIKDPDHLIKKIIRKCAERPEMSVTQDNYTTHFTDLIGVRVLHLFKDEWKLINDSVRSRWYLNETPTAYIRQGDSKELQEQLKEAGCVVKEHPSGYRSVHYLIKCQPTKEMRLVELQVRTIFEDGWSEIDHQIRYPDVTDNPFLAQFLVIFNRLAGSADEMGTFIKSLSREMHDSQTKYDEAQVQLRSKDDEIRAAISEFQGSEQQKEALIKKIEEMKRASAISAVPYFDPNTALLGFNPGITFFDPGVTRSPPSAILFQTCDKCGRPFERSTMLGMTLTSTCATCR